MGRSLRTDTEQTVFLGLEDVLGNDPQTSFSSSADRKQLSDLLISNYS